jgi:hypothetical protein
MPHSHEWYGYLVVIALGIALCCIFAASAAIGWLVGYTGEKTYEWIAKRYLLFLHKRQEKETP